MKLRFKFFIFMVGIPCLALLIFLFIATRVFVQDKTIYITESNIILAQSMAQQIDSIGIEKSKNIFDHLGLSRAFLLDPNGIVVFSSDSRAVGQPLKMYFPNSVLEKLLDVNTNEGSFEDRSPQGEDYIINYIKLVTQKQMLIIETPKKSAFRASLIFLLKASLTFLILILAAGAMSWWLALSMTNPLEILRTQMQKFASGDFNVKAPFLGKDEIGDLGKFFNKMVQQIQSLILVREDKLRFEVEMNLASDLQKKLFPESTFKTNQIEFSGYYEPASNCGGDWWFYFQYENKFVVCIGDVTGHGVHSALLTSACRATFSIISKNFVSTSTAMNLLNQSIYETAQGSINMTCVIAAINLDTGVASYTNASHESPIILPSVQNPIKKADFKFLTTIHGPRLGQDFKYHYAEDSFTLESEEHLFFYSDGVIDIRSPAGKKLEERKLLNILGSDYNCTSTSEMEMHSFNNKIREFRQSQKLDDDLSYFFLKWSFHAQNKVSSI